MANTIWIGRYHEGATNPHIHFWKDLLPAIQIFVMDDPPSISSLHSEMLEQEQKQDLYS